MNFEHARHYARGWLCHFFNKDHAAYEAFATAFREQPDDIESARHLASIAVKQQKLDIAEHWLTIVTRLADMDSAAWFNLGYVQEQNRKSNEAVASFLRSVELNPNQDRAWYGMGLAHARLGAHQAAADALTEAVRLQPMNGEAFYQLGMAWHHSNQPDQVTAVLTRLVGFDPKRAKQLAHDCERADLMKLIPELPF
jgi:tetratricopeptide (TPR) repeat protein